MSHNILKIFFIFALTGCSHSYLSVEREYVDRNTLASTFVGSPDPLNKAPPTGERLWLHWALPKEVYRENLVLQLSVIYKNLEEERIAYPLMRNEGWVSFSLIDAPFRKRGGLLTYKAEIVNTEGTVVADWSHQMWFSLIK